MQASKIMPNEIYAIERNGKLERFLVVEVVTRRTRVKGPAGIKSEVIGVVREGDEPANGWFNGERIKLDPALIKGPYQEVQELRERHAAEKAKRQNIADAKESARENLLRLLYVKTGVPTPNAITYDSPFRLSMSRVEIGDAGIEALTKLLERIEGPQ